MNTKILAVDDSLTIRQSIKFSLEKGGYQESWRQRHGTPG
ncbi:MAG: response regulator, partial [Magnetococcales bacterium]|nr:response regulator [Magnetococcales bacterium]